MGKTDVVVIGGSAGSIEPLERLATHFGEHFPAAIFVVVHIPEGATSRMPAILARRSGLPSVHPTDGEIIRPGTIYVAPPGRHMLVKGSRVRVVDGPRENGSRPAIDPLFRSAARSCGGRVVGVLLSGLLDDGTLGMSAIKNHGGVTVVQDPDEALFGDMPRNALERVGVDHVLPVERIAELLKSLVGEDPPYVDCPEDEALLDPTEMTPAELKDLERRGTASTFTCPECGGTLFELSEEGVQHYRCRVGHSFTTDFLAVEQQSALEAALWTALRAIEEHKSLMEKMVQRSEARGLLGSATMFRQRIAEDEERTAILLKALEHMESADVQNRS